VNRETGRNERTIRFVRESLGMTLPELALRTGLSEQRISNLENNIEQISPEEAYSIAEALGILPDELRDSVRIITEVPRVSDISALLETIDDNARRFISDKEIEQLENALRLSIDAVKHLKRDRR